MAARLICINNTESQSAEYKILAINTLTDGQTDSMKDKNVLYLSGQK